jgi:hypothetical protein
MNPGIAGFNAVFAHMLVGFFDLDLVQVSAFCGHRFLREKSLDFGQVTSVI